MTPRLALAAVILFLLRWAATAHATASVGGTQVSLPVLAVVAVIVVAAALALVAALVLAARTVVQA